ncbi:hypothetical protein Terro_3981 [Terriglobus roseus DSM 18391]|uniref:Biopolymer transporter Tol n=1 Tax=Terriglobus roseus (strain DSM 18391 / NRRL B-41598 / KBS 63) TaxID=926566 RepID=I3ZLS1_TERRK|nr:hypothetical protein [Terriglobus roseus]AFL90189.1 hypothetical protein Terro_3981 [Terriglobus roseus DSM 18391]
MHVCRCVAVCFLALTHGLTAAGQTPATPSVPDWAIPGSATHKQVPPPADFHRPTRTENVATGIFEGISEIGGPLVPGSLSFDKVTGTYRITSSGYNIWYQRDEFRFLWKRMSGDVSFAADVRFENPEPHSDRKLVLVLRQTLDDDSKEAIAAEHGTGMVHLAERPDRAAQSRDLEYSFGGLLKGVMAQRIGIEKHGDQVRLFVSLKGEPMQPLGPPITTHFDGPFYVGIGFCPHVADQLDTGVFSNVTLVNRADAVH